MPASGLPARLNGRNTETRTEGIATFLPSRLGKSEAIPNPGRNTETRTEGIATTVKAAYAWLTQCEYHDETPRPEPRGLRPCCSHPRGTSSPGGCRRNTETRTEGIATWRGEEGRGRLGAVGRLETKHRDPNRGDCDCERVFEKQATTPAMLRDETPRPEPRGLRPYSPTPASFSSSPDETPRPEPRGLRHLSGRVNSRFNCFIFGPDETRRPEPRGLRLGHKSAGICQTSQPPDETPRPEPRGLRLFSTKLSPRTFANPRRNTETRTEGIATSTSSLKSSRTALFSALTKHRDPNRGDCDW